MKTKVLIIVAVGVYVVSAFLSYNVFAKDSLLGLGSGSLYSVPVSNGQNSQDTAPKTEECPLNGQLYSKAQRDAWEARRPMGIMVQNNLEARPQSGLSNADIIHEVVSEGGITRFLALYYCASPKIVGSVRSARVYYITLLQGFGNYPLYAHVGGANTPGPADALGQIKKLKWFGYNDLDQFAVPFPQYWRDYDRLPGRATEHTVYTNTQKLWEFAKNKRGLSNVDEDGLAWNSDWEGYKFQDGKENSSSEAVSKISYDFWNDNLGSDYTVEWTYSSAANTYKRVNGGQPHIDKNTEKQLEATNVVVVLADESVANDGYEGGQHMLYDILGSGEALVFQNGQAIEATWRKNKATDMMKFFDGQNNEIDMVRGQIWISVLPSDNTVTF